MISLFLYESPVGYAIFEEVKSDETPNDIQQLQQLQQSFESFSKIIKIKSFRSFQGGEQALAEITALTEGQIGENLKSFLEATLAGIGASIVSLGLVDPNLASKINEQFGIQVKTDDYSLEIIRGIRLYFEEFRQKEDFQEAKIVDIKDSLAKTQINDETPKADKLIQESVSLLEQIEKDSNVNCLRIREWYGWHFPELSKLVPQGKFYVPLVKLIQDKSKIQKDIAPKIEEIVLDEGLTQSIIQAAECSMGCEISQEDMDSILSLCDNTLDMFEYQDQLRKYISEKMEKIAPNLTALVGPNVGAKLISHAGGLENLCNAPASTVQILGAEKALFRALKTKGNVPKYGLVYHSELIKKGEASEKNKAQIGHAESSEQMENQDKDKILEAEKALFKAVKKSEEGNAPKYGLVFHASQKKDQNS